MNVRAGKFKNEFNVSITLICFSGDVQGELPRVNSPWRIAEHMLVEDDLFAIMSAGRNSSMFRHVREVLQQKHDLVNKFEAEAVAKSEKLFEVLQACM